MLVSYHWSFCSVLIGSTLAVGCVHHRACQNGPEPTPGGGPIYPAGSSRMHDSGVRYEPTAPNSSVPYQPPSASGIGGSGSR